MEPETESPQPTRPAPEGRKARTFAVISNLLEGVFLLLCILAWYLYGASYPATSPWWVQGLIPATILSLILSLLLPPSAFAGSSKMEGKGRLLLRGLGILNIILVQNH